MVDSEDLSAQLAGNHLHVVHENPTLDYNISIINTCGFIEHAKEESINTILEHVALKQQGKLEKVYVTGCLSQRYKTDLAAQIPEVDAWFGTMEMPALLNTLNANYKTELLGERLLSTPPHYAYLKISEGCNRTCSFCAIPLMRGKHKSKPIENIIFEAQQLVAKGVKEIMLIAQELTYYGLDLYKERKLPQLLDQLAQIKGLEWIRLHYAYPHKFPMEIIDVIKKHPNICNYLDIPLQHASNKMLTAMKRQITQQEIIDLIHTIRQQIPNICLRTTLIVGFPGETRKDIQELKTFLQHIQFDRVGVFTYSHEEDTSAYQLKDTLTQKTKQARAQEIMDLQQEISYQKNQQKIGNTYRVLIDRKEANRYIARTEMDSVEVDNEVIIHTTQKLRIGQFYNVRITHAFDYDLQATPIP